MALPLPTSEQLFPAGGQLIRSGEGINAFNKYRLENQYYAPIVESEINNRNALTKSQNIQNEYMPEKLRLANAYQNMINKFYEPNIQSEINSRNALTNKTNIMTPLEAAKMRIENQFAPSMNKADIASKWAATNKINTMTPLEAALKKVELQYAPETAQADINYKNMGGSSAGVAQKDLNAFTNQLRMDNPRNPNENVSDYNRRINQLQSAYLNEDEKLADGQPLPELSGTGKQLITSVQNRNAPSAIKNQAANYDVLFENMNNFDIDAVKAMASPAGRAKLKYAQAQMAINPNDPNIDPMARRFLTSMQQSIGTMDALRKAWGTSVVPDYVYNTVGQLANPGSSMWNDATQVAQNWDATKKLIKNDRDAYMNKVKHGVTASTKKEEKSESKPTKEWIFDDSGNLVESK